MFFIAKCSCADYHFVFKLFSSSAFPHRQSRRDFNHLGTENEAELCCAKPITRNGPLILRAHICGYALWFAATNFTVIKHSLEFHLSCCGTAAWCTAWYCSPPTLPPPSRPRLFHATACWPSISSGLMHTPANAWAKA